MDSRGGDGSVSRLTGLVSTIYNELLENYDDGFWLRNRVQHRILGPIQKVVYGKNGIDVMAEDWDNLLILDACRADYFEEVADMTEFDDYRQVTSQASATPEWVRKNFTGKEFGDTVYVNGNPHVSKESPAAWHRLIDVWANDFDDEAGTVMADDLAEHAKSAADDYPNKRLIVHFNQPHGPYVGDIPLEFERIPGRGSGQALAEGVITEEEFRQAYRSNLEYVLPHARRLADDLPGKSVITADHGELFGKRLFPIPIRGFAHPMGLRDPDLVTVPWAVVDGDKRKQVIDDGTSESEIDCDVADERLSALGYKM